MKSNQPKSLRTSRDALLVTPGRPPCGCIIASVATGKGDVTVTVTKLTSPATQRHLDSVSSSPVELHIASGDGSKNQRFRLRGKAVKGREQSWLVHAQPENRTAEQFLAQLSKAPGRSVLADGPAMATLRNLYQRHGIRLLERLLPDFAEEARQGIENDLENAAEVRQITRLKDMRFILSSRQMQIFQDFERHFAAWNAELDPQKNQKTGDNELHVLQQHVFEDWLELQTVASGIAGQHSETLFALQQLLNQIFSQDINDTNNPISPRVLCLCLQSTLDQLGIAPEHRKTLYRAFGTALERAWSEAIQALIGDCTKAGLRTLAFSELPANWARLAGQASDQPAADGYEHRAEPDTPAPYEAFDEAFEEATDWPEAVHSNAVFRLMGLQQNLGGNAQGWQESDPHFGQELKPKRAELLEKLKDPHPEMARALRELADANPGLNSSLDQPTLQKASLVDQLFSSLDEQDGVSVSLKEKLEQLRLPVFEVLLDTPEFLNEENHPAREIVNDLMRLCFAERVSTSNLESTVSSIIEELIQTDSPNNELFEQLSNRIKKLVQRQDQSFLRNSERLAKTLEGKERLKDTRRLVQRRLHALLVGKQVPSILLELLASGWEQLMVLALLREGPDSFQYEELQDVITLLLAWLSPDDQNDELAFERELESRALLQFIDRELRSVGDITRCRSVMAELSTRLESPETTPTILVETYGDATQDELAAAAVQPDRWSRRAREISVGDWAEIRLDTGEKRRMRLVWGGEKVLRFVFLSPKGMSEVSFEFPEFVNKLATGEAWLVDEGEIPFVDQNLFNMVQDVYRRLNFEATHDALTGCMHRHDFEKHVSGLLSEAGTREHAGALIALDIDEFSVINATYGAQAGDALLQSTATILQHHCTERHPNTRIGRIGGNEFALLAPGMAIEESLDFAETLRRSFERHPFDAGEAKFSATLSVSVGPVGSASSSAGELLNNASLTLKAVKRSGGNRVELLQKSSKQPKLSKPQWVSQIDRSITDGSLYLRAQAIVPLDEAAGDGKSYELLLGLRDATGKEISPQNYIEAAEQFHRNTRVDFWVVNEVLSWMHNNPATMADIGTLNVNLSGSSLSDDSFMLELESLLKQSADLAPKVCFEVTETSAVANLHYAADFMKEMKRLGCRFALDDFGTGLSSYAYLQKLPVDYVKIDGIFVKDITTNMTNYAMVRSINELCHFLDLKTIAEYVENTEIIETLREIQVDYAQGFGLARPVKLDSLVNANIALSDIYL